MKTYSDSEKEAIKQKALELMKSGRANQEFKGLSDEEAMVLILPSVGFNDQEARFILARARGELSDTSEDEDGNAISNLY
ncbi:MAG: hypothetical protein GYA48_15245 [Chloroflexi bacterium]|nr:hypothetical protein [Chloroflexota bacterium]